MDFNLFNKGLTTLKGIEFPPNVTTFDCDGNRLTTLEGCPPSVKTLYCSYNQLITLKGCPPSVKTLYCHRNQLTTLEGCPPSITILYCSSNQLTTLEGCPPTVIKLDYYKNPSVDQYKNKTLDEIHNINRIKALKRGISLINNLLSALKIQRCWRKWWYEELDSDGVNRFIRKSFIEFQNI